MKLFVGTWNVGGQKAPSNFEVQQWLSGSEAADIYVLGFQEIIPLNSLLRSGAAAKTWERLIASNLNKCCSGWSSDEACEHEARHYVHIVSKQMVGIFITVWARREVSQGIRDVAVSCIGRGLMNYLGNKGSVSVSISLHGTSFCFVCSHLAPGEKPEDKLRRNTDVAKILKHTRFSRPECTGMPETIRGHDRVIWFGDLNYRLTISDAHARALISKNDWPALLEKDQLRAETTAGRVFDGWKEGLLKFAPTYKYVVGTDKYLGDAVTEPKERRTPAWCDRILWIGKGLKQLQYARAESRCSDHRPVKAVFEVSS